MLARVQYLQWESLGKQPSKFLSSRRRRLRVSCTAHQRSQTRAIQAPAKKFSQALIVEGLADKRVVQKAVRDPVFVLGSSTWVRGAKSESILNSLEKGLPSFERVVVLLDPDVAGRQGRDLLEAAFPGRLWHAFVPAPLATAKRKTKWHEAGNVGVEHASIESIREAVSKARQATHGREVFQKQHLLEAGLAADFGTKIAGRDTRRRRDLVCELLGIGSCNGKQFLRQLNTYGFTSAEFLESVEQIDRILKLDVLLAQAS